jgi:hypothetical protein
VPSNVTRASVQGTKVVRVESALEPCACARCAWGNRNVRVEYAVIEWGRTRKRRPNRGSARAGLPSVQGVCG